MIQLLLISKTPTNGHQFGQTRFGRVEWRDSENAGGPGECSDGRSTGTAETPPNSWQTSSLSNRETDLRSAESTRQSSGAELRGRPCPCGGFDRTSFDASCRTAIPMTLPRLRSIAALRHAWKAVLPSVRNARCCKPNETGPHHRAQAAPPTRPTTAGCRASGRTNHGQYVAFLRYSLSAENEGDSLIARPYSAVIRAMYARLFTHFGILPAAFGKPSIRSTRLKRMTRRASRSSCIAASSPFGGFTSRRWRSCSDCRASVGGKSSAALTAADR